MIGQKHVTRRAFLQQAVAFGVGSFALSWLGWPWRAFAQEPELLFNIVADPDNPATPLEEEHLIDVRLPLIAEDGGNVPIIISMEHPMEPDHYIESVQIVNFKDPIVSKGVYHFTPANGQTYLSTQIRMDGGDAEIFVIANCTQHGKWVVKKTLKVSLGGC